MALTGSVLVWGAMAGLPMETVSEGEDRANVREAGKSGDNRSGKVFDLSGDGSVGDRSRGIFMGTEWDSTFVCILGVRVSSNGGDNFLRLAVLEGSDLNESTGGWPDSAGGLGVVVFAGTSFWALLKSTGLGSRMSRSSPLVSTTGLLRRGGGERVAVGGREDAGREEGSGDRAFVL